MKVLVFSDIHGDLRALESLVETEADYYFAAGDMVNWGKGLDKVGEILARRAERMYVIPGNHESEGAIAGMCELHGLHNFHGQRFSAGGYEFAGLGYSNPTPFNTPGEYTEQELAAHLKPFVGLQPLVLVLHCPPKNTALDRTSSGVQAGSRAVREFIEQQQPLYFFCGHIHEAAGLEDKIGASRGFNVGKKGYLLELAKMKA